VFLACNWFQITFIFHFDLYLFNCSLLDLQFNCGIVANSMVQLQTEKFAFSLTLVYFNFFLIELQLVVILQIKC
jgi:hypothetical protein